MQDAVIVDAVRTASGRGKPNGALAHVHPVNLLAAVLKDLIARNGIDVNEIDADSGRGHYSTVTVLARLRGRSTLRPSPRAMA